MARARPDQYVIEAVACVLAAREEIETESAALLRFRADVAAACGRDVSVETMREFALDAMRQLSAAARPEQRRKFAAVSRCDVNREPHKVVAAELGLSRSQFYRDLQSARCEIGRRVERNAQRVVCAQPCDAFDMNVATIRALHSCGRAADAIAAARDLADHERGAKSIVARCLAVELLADNCQVAEAEIERAKLPPSADGHGGLPAHAGVMRLISDAAIALARLDPDAEPRARRALTAARLDTGAGRLEATALATSILARVLMEQGDLASGHALLAAYDRSRGARHIRPSLRASLIATRSGLYQFEPWALAESYEQLEKLLQCAVINELPRAGIDALTGFATLLCKQDNLVAAEPYAAAALGNARRAGNPEQVATALGTLSILLSESGRATAGLLAAEDMKSAVGDSSVWAVQGELLRSLALLRLRRIDETLAACRDLETEAARRRDESALGVTKRIMAEAYEVRGERRKALAHIEESVSLLEGVGRPYMLSRSYAVSHELSGNARHGSLARSLRSALAAFDARPFLQNGAAVS